MEQVDIKEKKIEFLMSHIRKLDTIISGYEKLFASIRDEITPTKDTLIDNNK